MHSFKVTGKPRPLAVRALLFVTAVGLAGVALFLLAHATSLGPAAAFTLGTDDRQVTMHYGEMACPILGLVAAGFFYVAFERSYGKLACPLCRAVLDVPLTGIVARFHCARCNKAFQGRDGIIWAARD